MTWPFGGGLIVPTIVLKCSWILDIYPNSLCTSWKCDLKMRAQSSPPPTQATSKSPPPIEDSYSSKSNSRKWPIESGITQCFIRCEKVKKLWKPEPQQGTIGFHDSKSLYFLIFYPFNVLNLCVFENTT